MVVSLLDLKTHKKTKQQELVRVKLMLKVQLLVNQDISSLMANFSLKLKSSLTRIFGTSLTLRRTVKRKIRLKKNQHLKRSKAKRKRLKVIKIKRNKPHHQESTTHMSRTKNTMRIQ
jgi:hypothetical protein